jgi:hypothetical protein
MWKLGKQRNNKNKKVMKIGDDWGLKEKVKGGKGGCNGEVNITQEPCLHVWTCHDEAPYFVQLIYTKF